MKMPRPTTEDERGDLKAATRQALKLARPSKFALVTRVEASALSKYGDPFRDDAFIPIDVVADLERDIGAPLITEALAFAQGYRLVPIVPEKPQAVTMADVAEISKEGGDVVQKIAAALSDGQIDPVERREISSEIAENIAVLRRLDRKIGSAA